MSSFYLLLSDHDTDWKFLLLTLTLSRRRFCRANQWTGFYMIGTSVMKKLIQQIRIFLDFFIKLTYVISALKDLNVGSHFCSGDLSSFSVDGTLQTLFEVTRRNRLWLRYGVFIAIFENIWHISLLILYLNLSKHVYTKIAIHHLFPPGHWLQFL